MRKAKRLMALVLLVALGTLLAGPAAARGGVTLGFHFGIPLAPVPYYYAPYYAAPYYSPYYYPGPIYYPPPVIQAAPPMELSPPAPAEQSWFYCAESRGYYPYVRECPGGWQRVPAVPPR